MVVNLHMTEKNKTVFVWEQIDMLTHILCILTYFQASSSLGPKKNASCARANVALVKLLHVQPGMRSEKVGYSDFFFYSCSHRISVAQSSFISSLLWREWAAHWRMHCVSLIGLPPAAERAEPQIPRFSAEQI